MLDSCSANSATMKMVAERTYETLVEFQGATEEDTTLIILQKLKLSIGSRCSAIGITTACGLDDRGVGVRVPVRSRIFTSGHCPDQLWGSLSLLSSGYRV
jgi:hypothetical protein